MKLHTRTHVTLALALLFAFAIGCKSSGTASSSTSSKTNPPKNGDSATSGADTQQHSTNRKHATPSEIAGKYDVVGSNPDGGAYKGTLEIIMHGDVYQFRWNAGTQYDGVGVTNGNVVAVAFANGENGKG